MLKNYTFLSNNQIRLYFSNNTYRDVYLTEDSGRIVGYPKKLLFTTVTHTGIILGADVNSNQKIIIHNHPDVGYAHLIWFSDFAKKGRVTYQAEQCINPPKTVIAKALSATIRRVQYRPATSNCQNFTNSACYNKSYSPDLGRVLGGIAAVGLGVLAIVGVSTAAK